MKHPEFEHVIWELKPAEKGKVAVAKGRGGPIQISYEVHGNGPTKLVVGIASSHHLPINLERVFSSVSNVLRIKIAFSMQQMVSSTVYSTEFN